MQPAGALSKVLGRGSAHQGVHHWQAQRVTAIALALLGVWFLVQLLLLPGFDFASVRAWIAAPWHAVLLGLLVICLAWHSMLGVQVVIEDYVPDRSLRAASLLASAFVHALLGGAGLYGILLAALKG